jgi:hypothetical protein
MTIRPRVDERGGIEWLHQMPSDQVIHLTNDIEVTSLAGGMESGKPSVAFIFKLPDGKAVVAETSLELFITAARGLAAAHE